jgi:PKD repeat protein
MRKNRLLWIIASLLVIFLWSCQKDQLGDLNAVSYTYSHNTGVLPVTVTFVDTVPPSSTVSWDFGDGQTGSGMTVSHTYAAEGLYKVMLSATTDGVTIKRTNTVEVYPYTQIVISQVDVTIPNPAWMHYIVRNSSGAAILDTQYASYSTVGLSLVSTPVPPLVINDFLHPFKVEIWNYSSVISALSFSPGTYLQSTLPFQTVFSGSDTQGRTVKMNVSWR